MSPRAKRRSILAVLLGTGLLFIAWDEALRPVSGPHSALELKVLRDGDLTVLFSPYFRTAGRCAGCHGHDPNGLASIDSQGRDVNVADDWRSTMMANSARDPFFRAKVRHEVIVNPEHQTAIENKCLSCHAPLGMHEEELLGHPPFTMAHLDTSRMGQDGVSCLSCHMQSQATAGTFFSGELQFDSARAYGPYDDDQINAGIMQSFVGFTPGLGTHITNSKVCAGCHTLITQTLDLGGNATGDEFVEQATYHEWLNSVYSGDAGGENATHCNTCHLPRLNEPIILAAEYAFLQGLQPFGLHHLVGGNVHMLKLLKENRDTLHIPASAVQFDSTITRTQRMITERTLDAQLTLADRTADTIYYDLLLENRAGHRFPSGYPSRRAFVEFVVLSAAGDTVFKSGRLTGDYEVEGHDAGFEPHYNAITAGDQVQIYELVMGDVNGDVTTVLERAKDPLKDNRLVPVGFTTAHPSYDTTLVAGVPASDLDFNRNALGEEGSGSDIVHYHVPISGVTDGLRAFARVYYQPVPPGWNTELFGASHSDIQFFQDLLQASDKAPTLVTEDSLAVGPAGIAEAPADRITLFPNPTADGWIIVACDAPFTIIAIEDVRGARVPARTEHTMQGARVQLPDAMGLYLLRMRVDGADVVKRVLRR